MSAGADTFDDGWWPFQPASPAASIVEAGRRRPVVGRRSACFPADCKVSRVATGTDSRRQSTEERKRSDDQASRAAIASAINRYDALSAGADESSTMRCRKKFYDALSVRTYPDCGPVPGPGHRRRAGDVLRARAGGRRL